MTSVRGITAAPAHDVNSNNVIGDNREKSDVSQISYENRTRIASVHFSRRLSRPRDLGSRSRLSRGAVLAAQASASYGRPLLIDWRKRSGWRSLRGVCTDARSASASSQLQRKRSDGGCPSFPRFCDFLFLFSLAFNTSTPT